MRRASEHTEYLDIYGFLGAEARSSQDTQHRAARGLTLLWMELPAIWPSFLSIHTPPLFSRLQTSHYWASNSPFHPLPPIPPPVLTRPRRTKLSTFSEQWLICLCTWWIIHASAALMTACSATTSAARQATRKRQQLVHNSSLKGACAYLFVHAL